MKLVVITDTKDIPGESEIVRELFSEGLELFHIRKPDYTTGQMKAYLEAIPSKYHQRIILHSHHKLALKYDLKGIHLKERQRSGWDIFLKLYLYRFVKKHLHISTSYHKLGRLKSASTRYTYVFLSPVFESISKKNHKPEFNLRKVYETLQEIKNKVIALGGVDAEKVGACRDAGFHGIGLLGTIWLNSEPVNEFKKIRDLCIGPEY